MNVDSPREREREREREAAVIAVAVIDVARHRKRSGKGTAQDSKRRAEVRLAPRSVEKGREGSARGMEGQASARHGRPGYFSASAAEPFFAGIYRHVRSTLVRLQYRV